MIIPAATEEGSLTLIAGVRHNGGIFGTANLMHRLLIGHHIARGGLLLW